MSIEKYKFSDAGVEATLNINKDVCLEFECVTCEKYVGLKLNRQDAIAIAEHFKIKLIK